MEKSRRLMQTSNLAFLRVLRIEKNNNNNNNNNNKEKREKPSLRLW